MMVKKDKDGFSHFFKEDDMFIREVIQEEPGREPDTQTRVSEPVIPVLPVSESASDTDRRAYWRELRKFFSSADPKGSLEKGLFPVVMAPQLTRSLTGHEFPVWINTLTDQKNDWPTSVPFRALLQDTLDTIDEKIFDLRILRQNMERIIRMANDRLSDGRPRLFVPLIREIREDLSSKLEMGEKDRLQFSESFDRMIRLMPPEGVLLPFSGALPFQLLEASMMATQEKERIYLLEDIHNLVSRLRDIIRVEHEKGAEGKDPEKLRESLGEAGSMLKVDALSSYLPNSGSESMDPGRLAHITDIAGTLTSAGEILSKRSYIVIESLGKVNENYPLEEIFEGSEITRTQNGNGCQSIHTIFSQNMKDCARLFAALRSAELVLEGKYLPELHDEYFDRFSWKNLTDDELNCCPFFVLIAEAETLLESEYQALSGLLYDNLPIKFLGINSRLSTGPSEGDEPSLHAHHELTGMLLSHKNLFVAQSTTITPTELIECFQKGMKSFSPAFFNILNIDAEKYEHPMLLSSAMIEGRDFPGFMYSGTLGTPWGSRFNISNNPQSSLAWPEHPIKFQYPDGRMDEMAFPFTFADQAALMPVYGRFFRLVEPAYDSEDLIHLADYMERPMDENIGKVPFIWMIDEDHQLHKAAVAWPVVVAAEERRDQWRFLQENSGIHNFHVERAVTQLREQLEEQHRTDLEKLKKEHDLEIEKVRQEEAEKVMENLTQVLLGLDMSSLAGSQPSLPSISSPVKKEAQEPTSNKEVTGTESGAEMKKESGKILVSEPYIDTALCTSCNECININGAMFKYNSDKMAFIADPRAGTFEDLVQAAENCPVGIIHPGAPLNPSEAGLDELIERAKPYN